MKMKMLSRALTALASLALIFSCSGQVEDKNENVYSYRIAVDTVEEGEDIPVHLYFSDAGLSTDNKSWGNPWEKAYFHATVKDSFGETVENTLWSSPAGVIGDGSRLDIGESGRLDLVLASLRQGEYTIDMNIETRYTVDTWATASFRVLEDRTGRKGILVDGISLPNEKDGMDVDAGGNIILDLAVYNSSRPYKYACRVTPDNATDKRLAASSASTSVVTASIEGETTLVLVPKAVGQTTAAPRRPWVSRWSAPPRPPRASPSLLTRARRKPGADSTWRDGSPSTSTTSMKATPTSTPVGDSPPGLRG